MKNTEPSEHNDSSELNQADQPSDSVVSHDRRRFANTLASLVGLGAIGAVAANASTTATPEIKSQILSRLRADMASGQKLPDFYYGKTGGYFGK